MILNYLHWNPDPEIINIFGFSLRYYGVLFITGLLLALKTMGWIFKKENLPAENLDRLFVFAMVGVLAGARLGHCLFYEPEYYLENPLEMILPVEFTADGMQFTGFQGLASHGGITGLLIAVYLYSRKTRHALIDIFDLIAVVVGVGLGFIRLANFMNSEIIGRSTDLPWAIVFERVDMLPRHPSQLYEAIAYFLIYGIMVYLYKTAREKYKNGVLFGIAAILFFSARFIIEFLKEDQVGFEEGMVFNMGQLLSLPYIALGIGFIIYGVNKTKSSIQQAK